MIRAIAEAMRYITGNGGRSSVGRAPDCDSGGRGFKPHRPPHISSLSELVQMSMVDVAQLAELRIVIPAVVGSSPIIHPNSLI